MGSLIMPHNIYLHSALVQTRRLGSSRPAAKREAMMYFGIESALSLVVGTGLASTGGNASRLEIQLLDGKVPCCSAASLRFMGLGLFLERSQLGTAATSAFRWPW